MPNASERRLARIRRLRGRGRLGLGFIAVELAHDVRANRPRRDLGRLRLLAFAVRLLVSRADEAALDEDVRALFDRGEDVLGEPWTEDISYVESDFLRRVFASIEDECVDGCVSVRSRRERTDGCLVVCVEATGSNRLASLEESHERN